MSFGDEYEGGGGRGRGGRGGTGRTRTRLPGNEPADDFGNGFGDDFGGPARRPQRSSRSLVTVVGVVVLLIAAIAFANRSGDGEGEGTAKAPREGAPPPTAATGRKPVTGKNGTIPAGFARDEQGAQSAAANYAVALGSAGMFQRENRHSILRAVHDPAAVDGLLAALDKAYSPGFLKNVGLNEDGSTPPGLTFVSRTMPVGTQLLEMNGDAATVEVWCTGLVGMAGETSTKPVTQTWFTITQKLKWVGGDWKIQSSSQKEGPTPVNGDNRASTADEIAEAVAGYGGFTYAR
ncbi:hypothetical protein LUW75_13365 [Streptomyces sp. MRC013]|uniref:hypothetical protein n=1 Tax=Streptomyces sp. MRC013 TaxID=2898276 RepID=UPI002025C260|nr:hypothetical protein [Streptomyces sp. MRC013]URM90803.1 hypothetical protein LUW75_13365 [Streptomyces sp. MRC013]